MNRKFVAKSNFVLRRVLNSEDNIDILKEFIEVILDIKIKEAQINPYLEKRKNNLPAEENFGIADLRIKTNENEELNIGIQIIDGEHILTKMFLYYAQIYSNQLEYDDNREMNMTSDTRIPKVIFQTMANELQKENLWYEPTDTLQVKPINPITGDYQENGLVFWFKESS